MNAGDRFALRMLRRYPHVLELLLQLSGRADATEEGSTMSKEKPLAEAYQRLVAGAEISPEVERAVIEHVACSDAPALPQLCLLIANQKRHLQAELAKAEAKCGDAEARLARLRQPPWFPADVLHVYADGRLDVVVAGRRQVVVTAPELAGDSLRPGDEVFLDRDGVAAVARNDEPRRTGVIGVVSETADGRVLLRGAGDEEMAALAAPELIAALRPGDRVLYRRETQCVTVRLPERSHSPHLLASPAPICFDDIGGLDDVIGEIRRDLDLHLLHPEVVAAYGLRVMRGFTLVGRPGLGKSMIAAAIANHVRTTRPEIAFLHVKPGSLRGSFYGESESRIRELFAVARRAPGLVLMFFDELDNFGARGSGYDHQIDDRVLPTLLEEINGIGAAGNVLCIGATNRLDLCDEALVRSGRFGDRIYVIPRPARAGVRAIAAKYLTPQLPYPAAAAGAAPGAILEAAVSYLFATRDGAGVLATATLANGTRVDIDAAAVLSGALIANAVERAKHAAAERHLHGEGGVTLEDVLAALDEALAAEAQKLISPHAARRMLDFAGAEDIVRVELPARRPRRYRYLRAA